VSSLDLCVQEGDVYGFLGPNGAGKTTAIRCIVGLIARDAGEVEIFGERDPVGQRAHVGVMVETPAFHRWMTARQNLERACAYAGEGSAADIDQALERVGLQGRADEKVQGYSLGMKQRLGIARALVGRPRLLLLDEPTNGLDPRGMREIRELLLELAHRDRLTIFVSSHLLGEVEQLCSRVGILERGRMVAEGTVDELLRRSGAAVTEVDIECGDSAGLGRVLAGIAGVQVVGDGEADRLRVSLDRVTPAELNRQLVQAGLAISALVPVIKRLEDLFLTLTTEELT